VLLAAALGCAAAAITVFGLHATGVVAVDAVSYATAMIGAAIAIALSHLGAPAVHGLAWEALAVPELGSYQLEEKLGEGGMGEVWRARHRLLARPAAVKLIRRAPVSGPAGDLSEDLMRRFEREARATATLRSPHTVELFDFGVSPDGALYYAMELLEGLTLDALVRRHGPVPAERAIFILRQVCHSLSEAEARGLVHRDIKPANIFLCRHGEDYDFVKVLDFGLVTSLDDEPALAATRTLGHQIRGTPSFFAPEQVLGREVDGRTDIYALGCVAYWLLSGSLLFTDESPIAQAMHHAQTPAPRLAERAAQLLPEALEETVMACLAKDPGSRPASARELSRRLAAVPLSADWTEDRARSWWLRHEAATSRVRPDTYPAASP
jgi:serine/threonine-protein kinase